MPWVSAGLLMCRAALLPSGAPTWQFLLVHPGGPIFANKDEGVWTIPKGGVGRQETALAAACREFGEETGLVVPPLGIFTVGTITQRGGKLVHAWAFLGTCDPAALRSNTFVMEWPKGTGRMRRFPEVDRGAFFDPVSARAKIIPAQRPFIDRALAGLSGLSPPVKSR